MAYKIVPSLWFSVDRGSLSGLLDYYSKVFGAHFRSGTVIPLGETPSGKSEMCEVHIFDQPYMLLNTAEAHHPLNDAVSFIINCADQAEIDHYWNYFTADGKESQCGWCIDKYGLRWQIVPQNMSELMSRPNAFNIMMGQRKIVIAEYFS